jgi:aspartate 1-decarboxylase
MYSFVLKAKIHHARVTAAELDYDGSLTIDEDIMELVKIIPFEKVLVADLENGNRFETYVISGPRGSGTICLNGATARLGKVGDRVIIFTFRMVPTEKAGEYSPLIVRLDERNRPVGDLLKT